MFPVAGRLNEQQIMYQLLRSDHSEFLAIYGRRRIGKTFLVRNVYEFDLAFQMTGKVVFFDELPWLDTPHSNFLSALEHFWNAWASLDKPDRQPRMAGMERPGF